MAANQRIEDWLNSRAESESTRIGYMKAWNSFQQYCQSRGKDPLQFVDDCRKVRYEDRRVEDAFIEDWQDIVRGFNSWLKQRALTPLNVRGHLTVLKSFCKFWKLPLDVDLPKHACVMWHNRDLKADEVRLLLNNATPRDRVLWLVMAESGLRVSTAISLKYWQIKEDFEAKRVPMRIMLPSSTLKDHVGDRWTFLGEDGFRELQNYLARRLPLNDNDFVFRSEKEGRVKGEQFSAASLSTKFNRLVQKLGIDKSTGQKGRPKQIRLHGLRKYFFNNLKTDQDYRNFWMGHSLSVDAHYISRDVEEHRKRYTEGYPYLRLYESDPLSIVNQLHERDEEIATLRGEVVELRDLVNKQTETMQKLIERVKQFTPPEPEISAMLESAKWAQSQRGSVHEYILERDYPDLVRRMQDLILKEGLMEVFKGSAYRMLAYEGFKYWVMPGIAGMPKTLVLNRAVKGS